MKFFHLKHWEVWLTTPHTSSMLVPDSVVCSPALIMSFKLLPTCPGPWKHEWLTSPLGKLSRVCKWQGWI